MQVADGGSDSDYTPGSKRPRKRFTQPKKRYIKIPKRCIASTIRPWIDTHTHTHTHHTHPHAHSSSTGYEHSYESASAVSTGSESEFEPSYTKKKKKKRKGTSEANNTDFVRMTSRKRGVVSYKEPNSDGREGEGSVSGDDVEGVEEGPPLEDNRETIERVLKKRMGPVEGS